MTGPKHLWSGDWEREAEQAAENRASLKPAADEPTDAHEPSGRSRARAWRLTRRQAVGSLAALLVVAVGVVLAVTLSGSSTPTVRTAPAVSAVPPGTVPQQTGTVPQPNTTPAQATATAPAPAPVNEPTVNWLGMQIITTPEGAVVTTVDAGGVGDTAGLSPGDVITSIGQTQINTAAQIRSATGAIALGDKITINVFRGSTPLSVTIPLSARPTIQQP